MVRLASLAMTVVGGGILGWQFVPVDNVFLALVGVGLISVGSFFTGVNFERRIQGDAAGRS